MKKVFLVFFCFISFSALAENLESFKVRKNLYFLKSEMGGNVVVSVGKDGVFIIDDQLTDNNEELLRKINIITKKDIKFVLNTHYHFDHTGGNEAVGRNGAIIISHDNVRKRLSSKQFISFFQKEMPALSKAGLPIVTFTENINLHYNNDDIAITHIANSHTDGDAIAYFKNNNVIVAGDIIFNGMYPFIDHEHGGSVKGIIEALDKIISMSDKNTIIIPGHGPMMKVKDVEKYKAVLVDIVTKIENQITLGRSFEDIIDSKPTKKYDKKLGNGFIKPKDFVKLIYQDLTAKN